MKHILVIDDTPQMAQLLQEMVHLAGYETTVAHDGFSGLTYAADRLPDLALVDLMMPDMDGWQVAARLRALAPLPIIFVTAVDSRENRARAAAMGILMVGKELDPDGLAGHIRQALDEQTPAQ